MNKRIRVLWMVSLLSLLLCGCMESQQLKERAIVQVLGIDFYLDEYEVTVQVYDPAGEGGQSPSGKHSKTLSARGSTILQACETLSEQLGKSVFLGNNKNIILGRSVAQGGISQLSEVFSTHMEFRPGANLYIAQQSARQVVEGDEELFVSADFLDSISAREKLNGTGTGCRVIDLSGSLLDSVSDVVIPILDLSGDKALVNGAAIFRGDELADFVDAQTSLGVQLMRGRVKKTLYTIDDPQMGSVTLSIQNVRYQNGCQIYNGQPQFTYKLGITCTAEEIANKRGERLRVADLPRVQQLAAQRLQEVLKATVQRTILEKGSDAIGMGKVLEKYQNTYWKQHGYDWVPQGVNVQFDVEVHVKRIGLT